jgi:hypothetical protein
VFEAITLLLAVLLATTGTDVSTAVAWSVFGSLVVLCVVAAATIRRGAIGWVIGSVAQVGTIATGFLVPVMFFLGAVFTLLWVLTYVLGQRMDAAAAETPR